ncbi:hypothetical protein Neosp_011836 [[Neocosmospora] mangrovei]
MESPGSSGNQRSFKRSYVACVSCRSRKSRCIVKDKPPCTKCEREHRECRFDHRQRGPKHREPPKWTQQEAATTSRQRPLPEVQLPGASPKQLDVSLGGYQGDALGFSQSPNNTSHSLYDRVRSSIVTGTNDALDILSDAVDRQRSVAASTPSQPTNGPRITPGGFNGVGFTITALSEPEDSTLDLWDKCRFVRQGLFTAQEAVTYMDLFFEKLQPLSPVIVDQFRSHSAHTQLVHEEAMLCCTILTIASRFFMLPGAGGTSRSHNIHQRLWSHCEMLIKRILLGQEKTSTAKTRAIGTVESLMLISDWHPRALHFPPETDGWDALLISPGYDPVNRRRMNDEAPLIRWKDDVFEPAKRANRMSWMLLGMANNLAYELGVISSQRPETSRSTELQIIRSLRAQKLLYVYLTQTATRDSLLIEYHHLKACTGAISIQAVVSRASSAGFTTTNTNPDEVLSAFITPKDARFLQEVISDSKKLLRIATMSDFKAQLPYAPARVKISVISSSVFLLKALSVGSTHTDVNDALYVLDQCTSTLNSSPPDDMDFALRYAALIEKHTAQFRAHLTASRGQGSGEQHTRSLPPNGVGGNETEGAEGYMGNMGTSEDDLGFVGFDAGDTWVSLPFDSSIAPFGGGCDQLSLGLDIDSLNFLWSLPGLGPE